MWYFNLFSLFQEHLAKHAGDKPYKCEVCPKQFNHKTDLRRHMCLHTGEKPFSCEVCGKGFIREDRMVKHAETHKKKAAGAAAAAAHTGMATVQVGPPQSTVVTGPAIHAGSGIPAGAAAAIMWQQHQHQQAASGFWHQPHNQGIM